MQQREQKRIEEEIKALRRLPGNKECADCKSLSNPYVCSDYNTFVCTRCAGIHRELGHRVKSVTAEIFTREEVAALKRGGNVKHNNAYLATWKESEFPKPAADDTKRIHRWFEEKYTRRRWYRDPSAAQPVVQAQVQQPQQVHQPQYNNANAQMNQGGWGEPQPAMGQGWNQQVVQQPVQAQQQVQMQQPQQQQQFSNNAPNVFNPFPSTSSTTALNKPAGNPQVNSAFTTNTWGSAPTTQSQPVSYMPNPLQQQQQQFVQNPPKPVQSSQDVLGLLMSTGNAPSTTQSSVAAPMGGMNGFGVQQSTGFGGFGNNPAQVQSSNNMMFGTSQPQQQNVLGFSNSMNPGMNTSSPANNGNTLSQTRAQPLSRGQQNNPFAGLVDIAPSVTPVNTNAAASAQTTGGSNNALDSIFSSAPQSQNTSAQAAPKSVSLIDF